MRGWRPLASVLLALIAAPVFADVISKAPEAVTLTVYRDRPASAQQLRDLGDDDTSGLALVTETRTVELPAGRTRIEFQGVADEIIPASARLDGLPGGVVERNFYYDLLDPGSLIAKSVGTPVSIRRTNPKTGQVSEEPATLVSGPAGVVVKTAEGVEALNCGTGPQALIFDHLPEGLADRPTLSVVADTPVAGRYVLKLSYLMVRVDWSADYVARLSPDGKTLDLTGWLTISNRSSASFGGAPTDVVAGHLARVDPDLPDITPTERSDECWPMGTTSDFPHPPPPPPIAVPAPESMPLMAPPPPMAARGAVVMEMVVTAQKRVSTGQLGDYKLYTLVEPTTVAARQTKQIRFLEQPHVRFETLYVLKAGDLSGAGDDGDPTPTTTTLSFENKDADGLGLSLPAGIVSLRQSQALAGGRELFLGEPKLRDVPVNEPFELEVGEASDVQAKLHTLSDTKVVVGAASKDRTAGEVVVTNAKSEPVIFELRFPSGADGVSIVKESVRHILKNGSLVWRLTVPANGSATLDVTSDTDQ